MKEWKQLKKRNKVREIAGIIYMVAVVVIGAIVIGMFLLKRIS